MLSSVDSLDLVYVPTSLLLLLRGYSDLIELKICKNNENGRDAQPVQCSQRWTNNRVTGNH